MLVSEFIETCQLYTNFQVWEVKSITDFFRGNEILATIFQDQYNLSVDELKDHRNKVEDSDYEIMCKLLHLVNDKSFFVFRLHDKNHKELVKMQQLKIMNFGIDIQEINGDYFYVIIMDKKLLPTN